MTFSVAFDSLAAMLLVFTRMAGMILTNPMLSRKNVPSQVKAGLVLALTILIAPNLDARILADATAFTLILAMIRELLVGLCCSYVFLIFYYLIFFAGDFLDIQFGMSMARVFDPGSNIQASVTGNLLSIVFILYIFATDSHLLMIRIFASSYDIISLGAFSLGGDIAGFAMNLFISAFSMALHLTLPFVVAEFVLEMGMGVLMKLIPQIHVFVINIQLKLLLGMGLLLLFAQPISGFLDNYMNMMFENMEKALYVLAG